MTFVPPMTSGPDYAAALTSARPDAEKRKIAEEFEAVFLAEFLRSAGAEGIVQEFGGGVGEEQFASLMTRFQAEQMAARGGLGIAEMVLRAMMSGDDARGAVS